MSLKAEQASGTSRMFKRKTLENCSEEESIDLETPLGEQNPRKVEKVCYPRWEKSCFFDADFYSSKPRVVMVVSETPLKMASEVNEKMVSSALLIERKNKKEEKAKEKASKRLKAKQKEEEAKAKLRALQSSGTSKDSRRKSLKKGSEQECLGDYVGPETPLGQKKLLFWQMAKKYNPREVEKAWYSWWEKSRFFEADSNSSKPPFVIVLPPPNMTGGLRIGHALTLAVQDTVIRWRRMSGYNTLWVPGTDHGGILTQVVVENKIMQEEKKTRHDLGCEQFISKVWNWKNEHGGTILKELRCLGASLDWSRECFTMDEPRSKAVTEAFVKLYKEDLIYRASRLVNWDCVLRTAISDIEVDYLDIKERTQLEVPGYDKPVQFGVLISFAYLLEDGLGEIVVATSRIETMLGDTAIAIHPNDERYKHFHGKFANHPFNGRKLPIICDEIFVDPKFGTGAVKIAPAHDPNDFEVGKRHNLEIINILTDDGKINSNGGTEFDKMPRFAARVAITKALKEKRLYRGEKNYETCIGICSRSNDVVEPLVKLQWFVRCDSIAKEALRAVLTGKLEIIPKEFTAVWKRWLENIRDWCISRQLWWGHRVPAWYATLKDDEFKELGANKEHWIVARNEEEARKEANQLFSGKEIIALSQDPDVLDVSFSSALLPLSLLGWPNNTDDFKAFYPISVLETGQDMLFFWVARMVMLGIKLGGDLPFTKVYLHPMIRDAHSKLPRSVLADPVEVINEISLERLHKRIKESNFDQTELEVATRNLMIGIPECGADALRFALLSYTAQSGKINFDILRVVGYRQWCNKLWNAVRFAMGKLGDDYTPPSTILDASILPFSCQWILSVLNKATSKTISSMDKYDLSDASSSIYFWWQSQMCGVLIEAVKPYFAGDHDPKNESAKEYIRDTLWVCLNTGLRLLHPFMPFVTEELWQRLPSPKGSVRNSSIMTCEFPSVVECWTNERVEKEMGIVDSVVKTLRALMPSKKSLNRKLVYVLCRDAAAAEIIRSHEHEILTLATLSSLTILSEGDASPAGCVVTFVNESISVCVERAVINPAALENMKKKKDEAQKQLDNLERMMGALGYKEKVSAHIQQKHEQKRSTLLQMLSLLEETSQF